MNEVSTIAAPDTSRATLPPVDCATWCEDGQGHVNAMDPEDQYCCAGHVETDLRRKPEKVGDNYYRRTITTSLQRNPFSEPFVALNADLAELTPNEAETLGKHLLELVALARGEATEV